MKKVLVILAAALLWPNRPVFAFNLWDDIKTNTNWTLGKSASAGTAIALRKADAYGLNAGDVIPSVLASIVEYRPLSFWWGGNEIPGEDGHQKLIDTAKVGINLAYLFRGFANQPPELIKNLVIGPSISMPLLTKPHVAVPFIDINYQFGAPPAAPAP